MPLVPIGSLDDPRLVDYRALKRTNETRDAPRFVVEGDKLVERLAVSRFPLLSVLARETTAARWAARLGDQTPVYSLPRQAIEAVIGFNFHQGALACGARGTPPPLDTLLAQVAARRAGAAQTLLVAAAVHNPENLGALFRTAAALGVDALVVGPGSADPLSRRVLRVSMGSALALPWTQVADVPALLRDLARRGYAAWAAVVDERATPLAALAHRPPRLALVLGSEARGLPPQVVAACQRAVTLPMHGGTDSLNLAVAAGIMLYGLTQVLPCSTVPPDA